MTKQQAPINTERILRLTLKKKWFDMIASGEKREEYREVKPYWLKRLVTEEDKTFTHVIFTNGYAANSPRLKAECRGISIGAGLAELGAPANEDVFIIKLGKIIHT